MKKIIYTLIAGLLPLTASATNPVDCFSGGYVGGGLGANILSASQKLVFDPSKVANTARYNFNQSNNDNTYFLGQLYLGYGYLFSPIPVYVAAEAIGEFSKPSFAISSSSINANMKQNNAYGGRIKLGYAYNAGLFYVLAGLERASMSRNVVFSNRSIYNSGTMFLQNIADNHYGATMKQVGTGINIALGSGWAAQLEYAHNVYDNKTYGINHTIIKYNNPKGIYTSEFNNGNEATLGIKYIWIH